MLSALLLLLSPVLIPATGCLVVVLAVLTREVALALTDARRARPTSPTTGPLPVVGA